MIGEAEILDPVSGNDVPPGSLPEEVRDDIDARLSEGEYVVPADVVRYFGVKFFEDLRSQAKMGLQQMDADGRIGGDPVPPEDSMEIAELKAELSESGMYAGGLTDGGGLDIFIDDASRSPMVNGRMRAGGATVNMAVGGLAVGNYGDVTKVDGIIQKLMTAANKDPALMQKLASKGIKINNTSADKKSAEMQQANKPQEPTDPVKMQEGGLTSNDDLMATATKTNPFLKKFSTIGGTAFEPMLDDFEDMSDEDKAALEAFTDPSGVIKEVFLVDAEGNRFTVAWNTAMPVPEGFTLEEIPEGFNATEPVYPAGTVINPAVQTERRTGDDGPNTPYVSTSNRTGRSGNFSTKELSSAALIGIDTDYKNMKTEDLQAAYETLDKRFGNSNVFSVVGGSLLAGTGLSAVVPLLTTGSKLAAKNKKQELEREIVKRYAEAKERAGSEYDPDSKFGFDRDSDKKGKYLDNEQGKLREELDILSDLYQDKFVKKGTPPNTPLQMGFDFLREPFDAMLGRKKYTNIMQAADEYQKSLYFKSTLPKELQPVKGSGFEDSGLPAAFSDSFLSRKDSVGETGLEKVTRLKREQQVATSRRLEKERKEREAREAAQRAAAASNAAAAAAQRRIEQANRSDNRDDNDFDLGSSLGTDTDTDYGATDYGTISSGGLYQEGGLVSKPAAKKQKKKQTTQRRKGLGTRP
jgi:hypothetical protein